MSNPLKYSKHHITAMIIDQYCDSFGTKTLKILVRSNAIDQTKIIIESMDEGNWIDPIKVLKSVVNDQLQEEVSRESN